MSDQQGDSELPQGQATRVTARLRTYIKRALGIVAATAAAIALLVIAGSLMSDPTRANPHFHLITEMRSPDSGTTLRTEAVADANDEAPVVEIATASSPQSSTAVFRRTSLDAAWSLFALAMSVLLAVNLALVRHLRRAYAPKSRRKAVVDQKN